MYNKLFHIIGGFHNPLFNLLHFCFGRIAPAIVPELIFIPEQADILRKTIIHAKPLKITANPVLIFPALILSIDMLLNVGILPGCLKLRAARIDTVRKRGIQVLELNHGHVINHFLRI